MVWWSATVAGVTGLAALLSDASHAVDVRVNLATQTMHVVSAEGETHDWAVSTARRGFVTPRGTYGVQSLQRIHFSRKYNNSPMPHSIFFRGGYAIHGTYETGSLGRAASHGCIRLSPQHAATLFRMVKAEGARITITGGAPGMTRLAEARPSRPVGARLTRRRAAERPLGDALFAPSFDDWAGDPGEI